MQTCEQRSFSRLLTTQGMDYIIIISLQRQHGGFIRSALNSMQQSVVVLLICRMSVYELMKCGTSSFSILPGAQICPVKAMKETVNLPFIDKCVNDKLSILLDMAIYALKHIGERMNPLPFETAQIDSRISQRRLMSPSQSKSKRDIASIGTVRSNI